MAHAANQELSIAFLAPSLSRDGGGIFEIERRLAQQLNSMPGVRVEAFGAIDGAWGNDAALWPPVDAHAYPYHGPAQFRWSPQLGQAFGQCEADVAHLHALWMHTSLVVRSWSRRRGRPYVTTVHGMLDAWAVANSGWKKRLCAATYERSCLRQAACLHAGTEHELESIRGFGLQNPVCIIPNGIDVPAPTSRAAPWGEAAPAGKKTLLYLGRLHPKKGLANLLGAWQALGRRAPGIAADWALVVAGWDQGGHEVELKDCAKSLGIERDVHFVGPLFGDEKAAAYFAADAFALPSFSEGLPMTVLEAWSHGKPVLMTPQCNLAEGFAAGAAVEAQPETASLAEGLAALLGATDGERAEMGRQGLELVQRKFTWSQVAAEMHAVYRWLVGGGPAPGCVVRCDTFRGLTTTARRTPR